MATAAWDSEALRARFDALGAHLHAHRDLWAPRPFATRRLPWEARAPEVGAWLRGLGEDEARALDADPATPPGPAPAAYRAWAAASRALTEVPRLDPAVSSALSSPRLGQRVPGRKWAQVRAFVEAAAGRWPSGTTRAVDWCAGKGHLGRAVRLATPLPVELLERRADLCEVGAQLMRFFGVERAHFTAVDVLEGGRAHLGPGAVGLGLHACGILWRSLLQDAAETGAGAVVAPCCYHHLGGAPTYRAMSAAGRDAGLELTQPELRLSVSEERVARPAVRDARRREQAWRLGLDLLLREASGEDVYRPQGPFPKAAFDLDFEAFCHRASAELERALPARWDPAAAERAGAARAVEVQALSQVRALFRRPMELWLVLDAAIAELERGRAVALGTFCAPRLTPRNLMLVTAPV